MNWPSSSRPAALKRISPRLSGGGCSQLKSALKVTRYNELYSVHCAVSYPTKGFFLLDNDLSAKEIFYENLSAEEIYFHDDLSAKEIYFHDDLSAEKIYFHDDLSAKEIFYDNLSAEEI